MMMEPDGEEQLALLRHLKAQALTLNADVFARKFEGFYLMGQIPDAEEDEWSFTTDVRTMDAHGFPTQSIPPAEKGTRFLAKIEKSDRNAFSSHISIGRATNNDIIIRHHSVSKLHAHIYLGSRGIFRKKTGDLQLADVGSANGTTANGTPLKTDDPEAVPSGSHVKFGEVHCELLDATALYKRLRMIIL